MNATLPSSLPMSLLASGSASADVDGEGFPAAHRRGRRQRGVVPVDLPLREPLEDLLERDACLESRERRAEAVVRPDAEGQVLPNLAVHVVAVRVVPLRRVP